MTNGVSLDVLISAALCGRPYNQQRLGREVRRYSRSLSKHFAGNLPDDLHEEIAQEAIVGLWAAGPSALERTTGRKLLRKAVLKAVYVVQAAYAPPGERTRVAPKMAKVDRVAAEDVDRIPSAKQVEASLIGDAHKHVDLDRMPSPLAAAGIKAVEDRIEINAILLRAPGGVAGALRRHYLDDEEMRDIAAKAQISRFALNRQITAFCSAWQAIN